MDVIIAGAGPVGLMLAAELRLHGTDVVVVEKLTAPTGFSKAAGLHARTVECAELRGFLPADPDRRPGIPLAHFAGIRTLRLDRLDTNHPGFYGIPQADLEELLERRARDLGATVLRGHEIVGLEQDASGVTVSLATGKMRASYLVGCDGGRSSVRTLAGFSFDGHDPTITCRLGDLSVPELRDLGGWHRFDRGVIQVTPTRVVTVEFDGPPADRNAPMTRAELADSVSRVVGRPIEIPTEPSWMSRFTDNTRLAGTYRRGRILLAGDAAHIHSPFGGQGLNLGLQDAMNLGWKLAAVIAGWGSEALLDTYTTERRPVAARVLHNTRAQVALMNPSGQVTPLRELFTEMMELPEANSFLGEMITGLDVRYECGEFVPPAKISTPDGTKAIRDLFHSGRPVLLDLGGVGEVAEKWRDRIDIITGQSDEIGSVLVRPDGYVCWEEPDDLTAALTTWFGPPSQCPASI